MFQPINGFDSKPRKILAGDTLYEYVSERFNGNEILIHQVTLKPEAIDLLANTNDHASDGDVISTVGRDIIIEKPSGEKINVQLVNDDQLATRKYTQIVQNVFLVGILLIVGLFMYIFLDKKQGAKPIKSRTKAPTGNGGALKFTYLTLSGAVLLIAIVTALSDGSNVFTAIFKIVLYQIVFVLLPIILLNLLLLMPIKASRMKLAVLEFAIYSLFAGLFGTMGFYVFQLLITRGVL